MLFNWGFPHTSSDDGSHFDKIITVEKPDWYDECLRDAIDRSRKYNKQFQ